MSAGRDTHFAGFATLLWDELIAVKGKYIEIGKYDLAFDYTDILARRAYDLVKHTIESTSHIDLDRLTSDEHVERIPDLKEWTEDDA